MCVCVCVHACVRASRVYVCHCQCVRVSVCYVCMSVTDIVWVGLFVTCVYLSLSLCGSVSSSRMSVIVIVWVGLFITCVYLSLSVCGSVCSVHGYACHCHCVRVTVRLVRLAHHRVCLSLSPCVCDVSLPVTVFVVVCLSVRQICSLSAFLSLRFLLLQFF